MITWVDDEDPCACCDSPYHVLKDCPIARRKLEEYKEREEYIQFRNGYMVNKYDNYEYTYPSRDPVLIDYQEVYQSGISYSFNTDCESNNYETGMAQSFSYQEEYDDCCNDYSQPLYEDRHGQNRDCYRAPYEYDQWNNELSNQIPPLPHLSHRFESLDEVMRKKHMAYVEEELTKPHLSIEDRSELLGWKYDLLSKEVNNERLGMTTLDKFQEKQRWISSQIGEHVVESEDDKKLATLEVTLSKLDEYLSTPTLPDQDRINCLISKCRALSMKIEIEERLSPLPNDIRDCSNPEEEIVEGNTTPMNSLSDEESLVDQIVGEDDEAELPEEMKVCTEPLPILSIPINKCGEEGPR